jgi:PIN domain nuclease of toxin-antitoxin system
MLSIGSVWEMQIKLQLGKLKLNLSLAEIIAGQQKTNGFQLLPIVLNHVLELENLAHHHKGSV